MSETSQEAHRAFLNRYYGVSRRIYDLTRKYFLLGRDVAINHLAEQPWETLIEVGPGTGRNLRKLKDLRPNASYGGIEASDAMLSHAQEKVPFAQLVHGFAENANLEDVLGVPPDRVFFAYCLSMVQEPLEALEHCRRQVAPGGEVVVVDFGDLASWPGPIKNSFRGFLDTFHVRPLPYETLEKLSSWHQHGRGHYWSMYRFDRIE